MVFALVLQLGQVAGLRACMTALERQEPNDLVQHFSSRAQIYLAWLEARAWIWAPSALVVSQRRLRSRVGCGAPNVPTERLGGAGLRIPLLGDLF